MSYLASLNPVQLVALLAIVIGVIGFAIANWGKVGGLFSNFRWGGGGGTVIAPTNPATDDDTLDFQAHGRLQKRFTRLNCPEGLAACSVQLQHFYHAEGHK